MSGRPVLYDLYSGAGGAARGYLDAGFEVWGVDIAPQPRYCGDRFIRGDAIEFVGAVMRGEYPLPDAWHASPPCQGYSRMLCVTGGTEKPKLIAETREALARTGRAYVIENVEMAKPDMRDWVLLCGTGFGLRVRRHRLFETSPVLPILVPPCHCKNGVRDGVLIGHRLRGPKPPGQVVPPVFTERELRTAIGVEWMSMAEMREAIPPSYCEFIGKQLLEYIEFVGTIEHDKNLLGVQTGSPHRIVRAEERSAACSPLMQGMRSSVSAGVLPQESGEVSPVRARADGGQEIKPRRAGSASPDCQTDVPEGRARTAAGIPEPIEARTVLQMEGEAELYPPHGTGARVYLGGSGRAVCSDRESARRIGGDRPHHPENAGWL